MRIARLSCVLLALVACVWFAVGARQAIDTSRATAIADQGSRLTRAQEHEVGSLVQGARLLNPDKQPDVLLGQAEEEHGDLRAAQQTLTAVTREEPGNLDAWVKLAEASRNDPKLFARVLARAAPLEPLLPFHP